MKELTGQSPEGLGACRVLAASGRAGTTSRVARRKDHPVGIDEINLYKDAIDNKTLEAQNALIFAGRVALVEGRTAAAVFLFRSAKNLAH